MNFACAGIAEKRNDGQGRRSVRSEIFAVTHVTKFPSPVPPSSDFGGQAGRPIPVLAHGHQTELETMFDFGCYNYAAPDGAGGSKIAQPFKAGYLARDW